MAPYKVKSKINVPNVVMMKVDELISYTRNAKLHPLRQVKKIAMSIEQYGFNIPVIIESDGGGYVESSFGYAKEKRLFEEILRGFPFQTVGDPFAGLATTILACEGIGKTGYCMEIDPDICAMALDRLKSHGLIVTRLKDPV